MSNKIEWSPEQELAISSKGQNILVSAGAGSGKTAVLSERIFRLVKSGSEIDRFLVLTFTNAAAAEMKDRIRTLLLDDPKTKEKAALVDSSHIETFDAFALYVVKRFHYYLNIKADVKLINASILSIQKNKFLDDILNELYENEDPIFIELVHAYCAKDDKQIRELILNISKVADLQINKDEFYDTFIDKYFSDSKISEYINECYKERVDQIKYCLEKIENLESEVDKDNLRPIFEKILECKDYDSLRDSLLVFKFPDKPREKNNDKELRDHIKSSFPSLKDSDYGSGEEIREIFKNDVEFAGFLIGLAKKLDQKVTQFEEEHNCYSFQDIAKMALKIILETPAKEILKNSFDFIMVDEYQDTSDIQEHVIQALGNNNIYMVGDVKQSIYRFRNANCNIFQEKYNSYSTKGNDKGLRIDLNKSFRSRKEIVDAINSIFSILMDKKTCVINYEDGHVFGFGQEKYLKYTIEGQNNEIEVFKYSVEEGVSKIETEAKLIAEDIINKINNNYQVVNLKTGLRNATFKDFAILIDRSNSFEDYRKIFNSYGIPINIRSDINIATSDLVFVVKNLLTLLSFALKQNYSDKKFYHAFASIARSFLVRLDDQTIYDHIKNKTILTADFILKIEMIKERLRYKSLYEILDSLYEEFNLYEKIFEIGDYKANISQAETLLEIASNMDMMGYNLDDFVLYFEDIDKYDIKLEFSDNNASDNSVTLMTIHKSKGLEYPITYFPGLHKNFPDSESKTSFIISDKYGLSLPLRIHTHLSSLTGHLFKKNEKYENLQERIRLYYVALTRAKEKIIILDGVEEKEKQKFSLIDVKSFKEFNDYLKLGDNFGVLKDIQNLSLNLKSKGHLVKKVKFNKPNFEIPQLIKYEKASKDVNSDASLKALKFGEKMHYLLEVVNYETKDTTFINDANERKLVDRVLKHSVFKNVKNDNVLHEYDFYDDINNIHGIIDCILLKDNEVIIIDFKLKNIDDEQYDKQLKIYKNYVQTITSLPIKTYLLSIVTGELKEVKHES